MEIQHQKEKGRIGVGGCIRLFRAENLIWPVAVLFSSPREGLTFGGLSQGRGLEWEESDQSVEWVPLVGDPQHQNPFGYIWMVFEVVMKA